MVGENNVVDFKTDMILPMADNKFKKLHHRLYEELARKFTKQRSGHQETLVKKNLLNSREKLESSEQTKMNVIMGKIYHGCATRYANGKRKLIHFEKCDLYLVPTSDPL